MTASETALKVMRDLPEEERMEVVMTISHELADSAEDRLTGDERTEIESILFDRVDGPFISVPEDLEDRVLKRADAINAQRNG